MSCELPLPCMLPLLCICRYIALPYIIPFLYLLPVILIPLLPFLPFIPLVSLLSWFTNIPVIVFIRFVIIAKSRLTRVFRIVCWTKTLKYELGPTILLGLRLNLWTRGAKGLFQARLSRSTAIAKSGNNSSLLLKPLSILVWVINWFLCT